MKVIRSSAERSTRSRCVADAARMQPQVLLEATRSGTSTKSNNGGAAGTLSIALSYRRRGEVAYPHQVVGGQGEGEIPVHSGQSAVSHLSRHPHRLQPATRRVRGWDWGDNDSLALNPLGPIPAGRPLQLALRPYKPQLPDRSVLASRRRSSAYVSVLASRTFLHIRTAGGRTDHAKVAAGGRLLLGLGDLGPLEALVP